MDFYGEVTATKALIQAKDRAKRGINHAAVCELEKAYEKLDRKSLLETVAEWAGGETTKMVRKVLGPFEDTIKAESD